MTTQKVTEAFSGCCEERQVTMGDFVPHTLLYLGKGRESKLLAIGYLRSGTSRQAHQSSALAVNPRESFSVAWLILLQSLSATKLQAKAYLRTLFRSRAEQPHHHDLQLKPVCPLDTSNVQIEGRAALGASRSNAVLAFFSKDLIQDPEKCQFTGFVDVVEHCLKVDFAGGMLSNLDTLLCCDLLKHWLSTLNFPARVYGLDLLYEERRYVFSVWSEMLRP